MTRKRRFMSVLLAGALSASLLGGCGVKTNPVPPQQVVPQAITDLSYELSDKGVTLSWTYPGETITGDKLGEVDEFSIYRAVVPVESYCETCPIPFGSPVSLPGGGVPAEGKRSGSHEASLLRQGHLYFFKIRARSGWWAESADSNVVSFLWDTPPETPAGLQAQAGDGAVALRWSPVTTRLGGETSAMPIRYQLHRSMGSGGYAPLGELQQATAYTDNSVTNGRAYSYKVQAVAVHGKGQVSGGLSEAVAAAPKDMAAPAAPSGVRALRAEGGVKIFWNPPADKDVAKYRVYRRVAGASAQVAGETAAEYTLLVDSKAPAGVELFYSVSALDVNGNESKASGEAQLRE